MEIIKSRKFTVDHAWGAKNITNMNGVTARLHWTNKPYKRHINDGEEVFVVLDGTVEMFYLDYGVEHSVVLGLGDILYRLIRHGARGAPYW
ncbi:MAG: mannose-6-phosphate isomerase-like protein (cupin superfamily) [Lentisphaeria bacterium]|jgi:mannose-6-phosphate isomerase-like protein (cupin superfamily)